MSEKVSERDLRIWEQLVKTWGEYKSAHQDFFHGEPVDRVSIIRRALYSQDRRVAVNLAVDLSAAEHMALFEEWVGCANAQLYAPHAKQYILSLPRAWVMERIEQAVEPHLRGNDEQDFRRYLELYYWLDRGLTEKRARRALAHPDESIQELGGDFLSKLEGAQARDEDRMLNTKKIKSYEKPKSN